MKSSLQAVLLFTVSAFAVTVSSVTVEGNSYVSDSLITRTLGLSPGATLLPSSIPQGVRELYALGYFTDIHIMADTTGSDASILVRIAENPILASVIIENSGTLKDSDILEAVGLFPGQTVSINDISRSVSTILSMYREKNRHLAEVTHRWNEPDLQGRRELVFICEQGPDVRVGVITFTGNTVFSDSDLRGKMKTRQDSFWRSGKLKPEEFAADLESIAQHYRNNGYPDAAVTGTERTLMEDGRHFHITIAVSEGPYREFGGVSFEGNTGISDSLLQRMNTIRYGDPWSSKELDKTLDNLYGAYQDRGYFYARINPVMEDSPQGDAVDLAFYITEGERAHIRRIQITGNTRTHDNVIRREFTMVPGQLYRRSDLMRSLRNVYYLNYFNDVIPDFTEVEGSADIDLVINVQEKTTGKFGIGTNYSGNDGFSGYLEVAENNLFGRGQNVSASYEFSKTVQNIRLGYTEPWFRDTPLTLGGEIYHTTSDYSEYDRKRTGGSILLGRPLPWLDYTSASIRYTLEKVNVFNITTDQTSYYYNLRDTDWPRWDSSVRFGLSRDSRDRRVFPGEGSRNTFSVHLAGGFLGGDIGYQKYLLDSEWHTPLWWKFFLTLRGRLGTIAGFGGQSPPAYELFQLGGTGFYGVRGYGERRINAVEGYETVGGKAMVILGAEYRFRIIDQLQLAAFFDAGSTWRSWSAMDLTQLNRGAGLGIRVEIPMIGVMGLDFAWGFDGPEPGWEPHFQMGTSF
jgi:outer membrane protein insertion porin family